MGFAAEDSYGEADSAMCRIVSQKFHEAGLWYQNANEVQKCAACAAAYIAGVGVEAAGYIAVSMPTFVMPLILIIPPVAVIAGDVVYKFCF